MVYRESRMKKFAVLVPLLLVAIMIFSMFMYGSGEGGGSTIKYNGYKIKEYEVGYYVEIDGKNALFQYPPPLLEDINITGYAGLFETAPVFYISYDPDSDFVQEFALSQYRLEGELYKVKRIYVEKGLTKVADEATLPEITCANATQHIPVIEFVEGNETIINILGGNCMRAISSSKTDAARLEDRIKYYLYGIMD